jgi:hypothetical protein
MFNKGKDKANSNKMHNLEIVLAQQDLWRSSSSPVFNTLLAWFRATPITERTLTPAISRQKLFNSSKWFRMLHATLLWLTTGLSRPDVYNLLAIIFSRLIAREIIVQRSLVIAPSFLSCSIDMLWMK